MAAGLAVAAPGGLALWLLVHVSSFWDDNGRGWHDKAAGTVVIIDPEHQTQPHRPAQSAPGPSSRAGEAAARHDSGQSYGLVSDYYAPRSRETAEGRDEGTAAPDSQ